MDSRDDRIAELEALLGEPPVGVRPVGIYPLSWKLAGLFARRPGLVRREFAYTFLYGGRAEQDQPNSNTVDQHVSRLRISLLEYGITIKTQRPEGWYMLKPDREKLRRLIEEYAP